MHTLFSFPNVQHTQPPLVSAATGGTQSLWRTNKWKTLTLIQDKLRGLELSSRSRLSFFPLLQSQEQSCDSELHDWHEYSAAPHLCLGSGVAEVFPHIPPAACAFLTAKQITFSRKHLGVPQGGESSHLTSRLWLGLLQRKQVNASGPHILWNGRT